MIGKRPAQRPLFDVGNVYPFSLRPGSFHAQLAAVAPRLFRDEDFASFYSEKLGRPSVPPSELALMTLLQHEAGISDLEAVERSGCDLRWAAVLGREAGEPLCAKSTLQLFRAHLILHEQVRVIFQKSISEAKKSGLLKAGPLRVALDTKPVLGRGAVKDAYNLLGTGIFELCRALARRERAKPVEWMQAQGLQKYTGSSLKGAAEIDWSDPAARERFLNEIVKDAVKLLGVAREAAQQESEAGQRAILEAADLLGKLLMQDIEPTPNIGPTPAEDDGIAGENLAAGKDQKENPVRIRQGTESERMPSATDPEQRHGRKSKSNLFKGHKVAIATEPDSQIITAVGVIPGNSSDDRNALELVEQTEENTKEKVEQAIGDCAYGSGAMRQQFADADRELLARVPHEANRGVFGKSQFQIDLSNNRMTCPGGHTTEKRTEQPDGGQVYYFGRACQGCALREQCTTSSTGRTVHVHPQEALLAAAREYQNTPEGKQSFRDRQAVEHRLARMGQLGIGQARYIGTKKTLFQAALAASLANFRRTWNWMAAQVEEVQGVNAPKLSIQAANTAEPEGVTRPDGGEMGQKRSESGSERAFGLDERRIGSLRGHFLDIPASLTRAGNAKNSWTWADRNEAHALLVC